MTGQQLIILFKNKYIDWLYKYSKKELLGIENVHIYYVDSALIQAFIEILEEYFKETVDSDANFFTVTEIYDIIQHLNNLLNTEYYISGLEPSGEDAGVGSGEFYYYFGASSTVIDLSTTDTDAAIFLDTLQQVSIENSRDTVFYCGPYNDVLGNYTYIALPTIVGLLDSIIQDDAFQVLGAFSIVKSVPKTILGVTYTYTIYKSNADKAFANGTKLTLS